MNEKKNRLRKILRLLALGAVVAAIAKRRIPHPPEGVWRDIDLESNDKP